MRKVPFGGSDTKYLIIIAFVVVIILLVVFRTQLQALITGSSSTTTTTKPAATTTTTTTTTAAAPITPAAAAQNPATTNLNLNLTLQQGSTGPEVTILQQWLGFTGSSVDGIFGTATLNALYAQTGQTSITLSSFQTQQALFQSNSDALNNTDSSTNSILSTVENNILSGNGIFGQ